MAHSPCTGWRSASRCSPSSSIGPGMPSAGAAVGSMVYNGLGADALALRLGLPRVVLYDEITSTMDVAHALASEGAPAGTLVIADRQTAGRGRGGRAWVSPAGA